MTLKTPDNEEATINKSILLNWLYSAGAEVSIEQLGQWLSAKTNGRYTIVKKEQEHEQKDEGEALPVLGSLE